ncbi:MAG: hypothetical protein LC740_07030 [Actinobacteria bacterium]|nr:hypothetical protein [Actinomycetota bacterium]
MPIDPALIEALRVERFEEEDMIGALHVELLEREKVRGVSRFIMLSFRPRP